MDVKETIMRALSPDDKIDSSSGRGKPFVIRQLEPTVVIDAGESQRVGMKWEEFQTAADLVEQRSKILIKTPTGAATRESLQSEFGDRGWTKRHANYVAAILKKAGIVDYDKPRNEGIYVLWRSRP